MNGTHSQGNFVSSASINRLYGQLLFLTYQKLPFCQWHSGGHVLVIFFQNGTVPPMSLLLRNVTYISSSSLRLCEY